MARSLQLDSCARLHIDAGERVGSYFALGVAGTACGAAVVAGIAVLRDLPPTLPGVLIATSLASFLAAVKASQIVLGYERIVLYELFLLALGAAALALGLGGLPLRDGLDLATIGIGTMLIFGRIGCLRVGCCHGRPAAWGIVYGGDHALAGFPRSYVGVRLFAVQIVEAAVTAALVAFAVAAVFVYPPGQALWLYASLYGVIRFGLELLRGDATRPHVAGVSEAQWLALVTAWAAVWAASAWDLPLWWLHVAAAATLTLAVVALVVANRTLRYRTWWFRDARRAKELADALYRLVPAAAARVALIETPGGLRVSCSLDHGALLLGLSCPRQRLSPTTALALARDIGRVTRLSFSGPEPGHAGGVFHLRAAGRPSSSLDDGPSDVTYQR